MTVTFSTFGPGGRATPAGQVGPAGPAGAVPGPVRVVGRTGFTVAADGSYAACLAEAAPPEGAGQAAGERWFPERWTLSGPEPYAVPLPGGQPEEAGAQVVPLPDGRVLLRRRVADRHDVVLLYPTGYRTGDRTGDRTGYPTGPGTGELPVCSLSAPEVRLLPPSPAAGRAYALAVADGTTAVWQVYGDGAPARVMTVAGRCTGGVWLDRAGRLLALDRELDGRAKAVAADLLTGEVSPLLQLTDDSDDRLLLAEPDSGLLLLRSDATGEARLGWGVLGSRRPVRFPDALRLDSALLTPVAAQPGHILSPESCVVAFRAEVPGGARSLALWRPGERRVHWRPAPSGWLGPTALWLPGSPLRLPHAPCALTAYDPPPPAPPAEPLPPAPPLRAPAPAPSPVTVLPLQQAPLAPPRAKAG